MLHMPSPMLMQSGEKTYAEFQAHIAARAPDIRQGSASMGYNEGAFRIVVGNTGGLAWGSVWRPSYARGGAGIWNAGVRHGLPSSAVFSEQMGLTVLVVSRSAGNWSSLASVTRNGLTTSSITQAENGGFPVPGITFDELSYWDTTLGAPLTMIPSAVSDNGPHPYSHPDWNS